MKKPRNRQMRLCQDWLYNGTTINNNFNGTTINAAKD